MSYWCDDTLVVRIRGPAGEREVALERPFAVVGSHRRSHIVLEGDEGVSKRALALLAMEGGIYCADLDVERADPDQPGRWLGADEPIQLGSYTLSVRLGSSAAPARPSWNPQTARSAAPIPVLHVYGGGVLKDRRRLRHPLAIIGRRPQCLPRLRGEMVSSFHCLLYWCDRRLWCLDLISSSGTRIGDELIGCREVTLGERLDVGEFGLVYYRWSPRQATPGREAEGAHAGTQELEVAFDASMEALDDPDEEGSLLGTSVAAIEAEQQSPRAESMEAIASEREEFELQKQALDEQRVEADEQWELRRQELEAQAAALAVERDSLARARRQWEDERIALSRDLAQRGEELAQAKRELAELQEKRSAPDSAGQTANAMPTVAGRVSRWLEEPAALEGSPEEAAEMPVAEAADAAEASLTVAEPIAATAESLPVVALPAGRRKSAKKEGLTSFVSERLSDIEHVRRRRALILWTAVTLTALVTAAAGFGLWFWLR